ncbi:YbhB/YbcL family Raf kinase inhibitor-like protein [Methanolobus halotolerans]|uniref:YbhB/YbcL family Raf kinase inhibitor-like protein n=1 Tax=Methanolobus halotolerans TaxID=2052935 RepID=A0A4E0Q9H1_9EURY|nr:YbhB/YbcL family Raf kinase inhibitor-like protein [Methanolobus halotolerans]TGC08902.1 YbhB/YbcL family Raf kinase inhibitor-like protein [Methanolobus halotolerans]
MEVVSSAFEHGEMIPAKYTCDGDNVSPPLQFNDLPSTTMSLVVMVDGIDSSSGTMTHWIVWNIPFVKSIAENSVPGVEGKNGFNTISYCGPCPSSGTHSYYFIVYALDARLDLQTGTSRNEVENAMRSHILDKGELMGKYGKQT